MIPPLVAVFVGTKHRPRELGCYPPFVEFLAQELLPWIRGQYPVTTEPARTVVGGFSAGGLAAVFAALKRPDAFGNVLSQSGGYGWKPEQEAEWEWFTRKAAFVAAFRAAGGRVAAGSDTANPFVVPGVSLHQELELLVAAGLSPLEAIRAATGTAADLLRRPDLGVIAEGKLADLVLVAGNPAERIGATRDVRVVLKGGAIVYAAPEAPSPTLA